MSVPFLELWEKMGVSLVVGYALMILLFCFASY